MEDTKRLNKLSYLGPDRTPSVQTCQGFCQNRKRHISMNAKTTTKSKRRKDQQHRSSNPQMEQMAEEEVKTFPQGPYHTSLIASIILPMLQEAILNLGI